MRYSQEQSLKSTHTIEFGNTDKPFARPKPDVMEFVNTNKPFMRPKPDAMES